MASAQNGFSNYVKLEERLVLLAWLNDLFGYQHNRDLLADMKEAAEGFDASGRSSVPWVVAGGRAAGAGGPRAADSGARAGVGAADAVGAGRA